MKERPISFSTPMVKAITSGIKSMTRRVKKNESCPYGIAGDILWVREEHKISFGINNTWICEFKDGRILSLYYKKISLTTNRKLQKRKTLGKWQRARFLPKEFARIWLEITESGYEHLHDISESDIVMEGVRIPVNGIGSNKVLLRLGEKNSALDFLPSFCLDPDSPKLTQKQLLFAHFAELWCEINGRDNWDENPLVWVLQFKVLSTHCRIGIK